MIRYAQYKKGDRVSAETFFSKNGEWLYAHGIVLKDNGERELLIKTDDDSNFAGKELIVYKDRLF